MYYYGEILVNKVNVLKVHIKSLGQNVDELNILTFERLKQHQVCRNTVLSFPKKVQKKNYDVNAESAVTSICHL